MISPCFDTCAFPLPPVSNLVLQLTYNICCNQHLIATPLHNMSTKKSQKGLSLQQK